MGRNDGAHLGIAVTRPQFLGGLRERCLGKPVDDEQRIRDLLDLNLLLLTAAIDCASFSLPVREVTEQGGEGRMLNVFRRMAWGSQNGELARTVEETTGRLGPVLRLDTDVLSGPTVDLDAIENALLGISVDQLRLVVTHYHTLRRAKAAAYAILLRRTPEAII